MTEEEILAEDEDEKNRNIVRLRKIKAEFEQSIKDEAKQKIKENPNYGRALKDNKFKITTDFNGKMIKVKPFQAHPQ